MPVAGTFAAASARGFGFGTEDMFGEQIFSVAGTYTFYVPAGVTSISVVSIGGGGGGGRPARYTDFENPNTIAAYSPTPGSLTANYYSGGGGGLAYKNAISVTPGQPLTVFVGSGGGSGNGGDYPGQETYVANSGGTKLVRAGGGSSGSSGAGGTMLLGDGGGSGGAGGNWQYSGSSVPGEKVYRAGGGGGAGGYTGNGGAGGNYATVGSPGSGGGGGGGAGGSFGQFTTSSGTIENVYGYGGGAGGGTGLFGLGSNGAGGTGTTTPYATFSSTGGGGGGSSGTDGRYADGRSGGNNAETGYGLYGGGGGCPGSSTRYDTLSPGYFASVGFGGEGADGAVRIIWTTNPTITRSFPSTNVGQL